MPSPSIPEDEVKQEECRERKLFSIELCRLPKGHKGPHDFTPRREGGANE